jgi:hypothetical protein
MQWKYFILIYENGKMRPNKEGGKTKKSDRRGEFKENINNVYTCE